MSDPLARLADVIENRKPANGGDPEASYVARLLHKGPDAFLKKIKSSEAIENIMHFADKKADKMLAKSDGNKRSRISNEKLVDANFAGSRRGHECTLILTEGCRAMIAAKLKSS